MIFLSFIARWKGGWMDGRTDGQADWVEGWVDGWMDGRMDWVNGRGRSDYRRIPQFAAVYL